MDYVMRTYGLTKKYKNKTVLDSVNINVRKGDIYGLIGRNGAGKTTLIKLAAGIASPSGGSIELFGSSDLNFQRRRIGTIIEYPAVYPTLTAKQNLEVYRRLYGIPDEKAVDRMLDTVGLSDTGRKPAKAFSLGMKQRLGIAAALLGNPDLLLLDEPINGLDPEGISDIRELLIRLNSENNITMLISSHILSELSKTATCYGVISEGQLIEEITSDELSVKCKRCLKITVSDPSKASTVLENVLGTSNYDILPDNMIRLFDYIDESGKVVKALVENGVDVSAAVPSGADAEEYFLEKMGVKKK